MIREMGRNLEKKWEFRRYKVESNLFLGGPSCMDRFFNCFSRHVTVEIWTISRFRDILFMSIVVVINKKRTINYQAGSLYEVIREVT